VLLISFVYVMTSVLADLVYAVVDPRIRLAR
jgi:peptide/nickel transport system permease protein